VGGGGTLSDAVRRRGSPEVGMRILFATRDYFPAMGGVQVFTHDLATRLLARGNAVGVLTWKRPASASGRIDQVVRKLRNRAPLHVDNKLGYPTIRSIVPQEALRDLVRSFEPDIVVVNGAGGHTRGITRKIFAEARNVPKVLFLRDVASTVLVGEPGFRADLVVAASRFLAEEAIRHGGEATWLPSIFDRERYRIETSRRVVLFVNPVPQKGLDIAFALAGRRPDIPFAFVRCWNLKPSELRALRSRTRSLQNVELRATVDDPAALYGDAKILLVPSVYPEGWPRVISEAQVSGIPAIGSRTGGIPEAIGPGGILVDPEAPIEEWLGALSRLWDDRAAYEECSAYAVGHIGRSEMDSEVIVDRIEGLLSVLIRQGEAPVAPGHTVA
jgi:glycosyltransferase involved in cell wall biosynthesis